MKKFIKTFILAICLVLPSLLCLTACGDETAKVSSFSVELANTSYTLAEDTITVVYGEDYRLSFSDFSVTATFEDETSRTLTSSKLPSYGFTLSSTIPNDNVTPVGEYTLTLGHKNLPENDYTIIKVKVIKKTINLKTLGLTWKDEVTPIVYDGEYHTNEITNLPEYLEIECHNDNREMYPNGAVNPETNINIGSKYYAQVSIKVKDEYADRYEIEGIRSIQHEWTIQKAEMTVPDIDLTDAIENYTYTGAPITTKIKDEIKEQLENKNIATSLSGSETETGAGEYQVTISFKYTGEDKTCYNLGDEYLIGTRIATWKINRAEIDVSDIKLKIKNGDDYIDYNDASLIYDGTEKSVVFDLSSLGEYVEYEVCPYEFPAGTLPSTGGRDKLISCIGGNGAVFKATNAGTYTATIEFSLSTFNLDALNYTLSSTTITKEWKINQKELTNVSFLVASNDFVRDEDNGFYYAPYKLIETNGIVSGDDVGVKIYALRQDIPTVGFDFWAYYDTFLAQGDMGVFFDETSIDNSNYKFKEIEGYNHFGTVSICTGVEQLLTEIVQRTQTQYYKIKLTIPVGGIALGITSSDADFSTELFDENFNKIEYGDNQNYKELTNNSEQSILGIYYVKVNSSSPSKIMFYNYAVDLYVNNERFSTIYAKKGDEIDVDISSKLKAYHEFDYWSLDEDGEIPAETITRSGNIYAQLKEVEKYKPFEYWYDPDNGITITGVKADYKSMTSFMIPNEVEVLDEKIFQGFSSLKSVTFEENSRLRKIDWYVFGSCSSLTNITLPNTVTSLSRGVFYGCTSLTSVTIPTNVKVVNSDLFCYCTSLISVVIPSGVTNIGQNTFLNCSAFTTIYYLGNSEQWSEVKINTKGIEYINNATIYYYSKTKPNDVGYYWHYDENGNPVVWRADCSITYINTNNVENTNPTTYTIGDEKITFVPLADRVDYTFDGWYYNNEKITTIPHGLTGDGIVIEARWIQKEAYKPFNYTVDENGRVTITGVKNNTIASVNIPNTVVKIKDNAFNGCSSLESVTFENNSTLTTICSYAFNGCTALKQITIPNTVVTIDGNAFSGCSALAGVIFEKDSALTTINGYAFADCTSLKQITIPKSVTTIGWDILRSCTSLTTVTFEEGSVIEKIGASMFYGCSTLTTVEFPSSVTTLEFGVFTDCSALTSIVFPSGATEIADIMFEGCTSLTSIVIPDGVTSIGWRVFYGCTSLSSIVMPNTVTSIGSSAFYDCTALAKVYYKGTAEDWAKITISSDGEGNTCLTADIIYYYSESAPSGTDNYWHYDEDKNLVVWANTAIEG